MMKRPRSFISTLVVVLCLASVGTAFDATRHVAVAVATPRVMAPRAGDPTEPSDGIGLDGDQSRSNDPDLEFVRQAGTTSRNPWLSDLYVSTLRLFTFWHFEGWR